MRCKGLLLEGLRGRHKQVLRDRDSPGALALQRDMHQHNEGSAAGRAADSPEPEGNKVGWNNSSTWEGPCPLPHSAGVLGNQRGSSVTSLQNKWNQSVRTMLCCLLLLTLLLGAVLPQPGHQR